MFVRRTNESNHQNGYVVSWGKLLCIPSLFCPITLLFVTIIALVACWSSLIRRHGGPLCVQLCGRSRAAILHICTSPEPLSITGAVQVKALESFTFCDSDESWQSRTERNKALRKGSQLLRLYLRRILYRLSPVLRQQKISRIPQSPVTAEMHRFEMETGQTTALSCCNLKKKTSHSF